MRYTVFHQGQAKKSFDLFVDAWLFCILDLPSWSRIRGINGEVWIMNPPLSN